jgi:trk system potassium uptake protein TrkH
MKGIWFSIFHSVSAFCNAGFDLMGGYNSFVNYKSDFVINFTISSLIIIGGIGFIVWADLKKNKFHFKKYHLHTKMVLVTSIALVFGGAVVFYFLENNNSLSGLTVGEKIGASFFQSITMRTAGFNTVDFAALSDSGSLFCVLLMFIGGSPGSTAGGTKTTTFLILILAAITSARRKKEIFVFNRKIDKNDILTATAISTLYIMIAFLAVVVISALDSFSLKEILFEVISAENTVGVTMGITRGFCSASKLILMFLMFIGRIGGLTLALLFLEEAGAADISRPTEKILVG